MPIDHLHSFRRILVAALLVIACRPSLARAGSDIAWNDTTWLDTSHCAPATGARLQWLVTRLESRERYADLWWRGWISFYAIGVAVEGTKAGLDDDRGDRANDAVSAAKAVGGVARLYFTRPTARLGADPLQTESFADEAACQARVAQGEALLRKAAEESDRRWSPTAHLVNVAVNVAGALIVTQGFDEDDGWTSAAVGIAVGEAMQWSHPWSGHDDLDEYETRFATGERPGTTWGLTPYGRGLALQVRF
jgi:hypothetical protein